MRTQKEVKRAIASENIAKYLDAQFVIFEALQRVSGDIAEAFATYATQDARGCRWGDAGGYFALEDHRFGAKWKFLAHGDCKMAEFGDFVFVLDEVDEDFCEPTLCIVSKSLRDDASAGEGYNGALR